jgi:hypothetical protein
MGMKVEFNWFIVAKKKEDIVHVAEANLDGSINEQKFALRKSGPRIYPIGKQFTLPVIAGGKCIALASVTNLEIDEEGTTVYFIPVQIFNEDDPIALYYEKSFAEYKARQEIVDDGGRIDLTPKFIERLHGIVEK